MWWLLCPGILTSVVLVTADSSQSNVAAASSQTPQTSTNLWWAAVEQFDQVSTSDVWRLEVMESVTSVDGPHRPKCTNDYFTLVLYGIVASCACLFGITGNTVSICILFKDVKTPVASFQLIALSVVNNLLIGLWFMHYCVRYVLRFYGVETDALTLVRVFTFPVLFMAQTATIWLTVVIAFNCYMAVCWPYKAPQLHKLNVVYRQVATVGILSVLYNIPRCFELTVASNCTNSSTTPLSTTLISTTTLAYSDNDTRIHDHVMFVDNATASWRTSCKLLPSRTFLGASELYRQVYTDALYYLLTFGLPLVSLTAMSAFVIVAYRAALKRRRLRSSHLRGASRRVASGGTEDLIREDNATASVWVTQEQKSYRGGTKRCWKTEPESSVTLVMIIVIVVFIGCQALARFVQIVWGYVYTDCRQTQYYLIHVSNTLEVFNSLLNFVVYCTFHRYFRLHIAKWMRDNRCPFHQFIRVDRKGSTSIAAVETAANRQQRGSTVATTLNL